MKEKRLTKDTARNEENNTRGAEDVTEKSEAERRVVFDDFHRKAPVAKARSQLSRCRTMTQKAEGTKIVEIALAAALGHGDDVVSIPQAATAGDSLHSIEAQTRFTSGSPRSLERGIRCNGVDLADGASATIAREDLVAEIARVGAKAPLVYTVVAAERPAPPGDNFKLAPATERQTVRSDRKIVATGATARECTRKKHGSASE